METKVKNDVLKMDLLGKAEVKIVETTFIGEKTYDVVCFDYVINEWTEFYGSDLPKALARVAVLARCCSSGEFDFCFANNQDEFWQNAEDFLNKEVVQVI